MFDISAILGLVGGAVGSYGTMEAGDDAYQAGMIDAMRSERNAQTEIYSAQENARRQRVKSKKDMGSMRANFGASGTNAAESSAEDIIAQSAMDAELDALTIEYAGNLRADEYMFQASQQRRGAESDWANSRWSAAAQMLGAGGGFAKASQRGNTRKYSSSKSNIEVSEAGDWNAPSKTYA